MLEPDMHEYLLWEQYNLYFFPPPAPYFQLIAHMPAIQALLIHMRLLYLFQSQGDLAQLYLSFLGSSRWDISIAFLQKLQL